MLALDNIVVRIAGREILSGATANLPAGRRMGLVGRNGAGKSTLFKVILGEIAPDGGQASWPSAWSVGAVAQEAPGSDQSLIDTVLAADNKTQLVQLARQVRIAHPARGVLPAEPREDGRDRPEFLQPSGSAPASQGPAQNIPELA